MWASCVQIQQNKFQLRKSRTNVGEHSAMLRLQKLGNDIGGKGVDITSSSYTINTIKNIYTT